VLFFSIRQYVSESKREEEKNGVSLFSVTEKEEESRREILFLISL